MAERLPTLDWEIQDNEATEESEPLADASEHPPVVAHRLRWALPHRSHRILRVLAIMATLTVVALALIAWQRAHDNLMRIRSDIESTILLEGRAWVTQDRELAQTLIDSNAPAGWRNRFELIQSVYRRWSGQTAQMPQVEVRDLEVRGDVARVETVVTQPGATWAPTPYRETRFYRRVDGRWLRTAPDATFWGQQQTTDTPHFHFIYYDRDAQAVKGLAAQAETLYAGLRTDVGLEPAPATAVITVEILPRIDLTLWHFSSDTLDIPSPALQPVPVDRSDTNWLAGSLAGPLRTHLVQQALAQTPIKPDWQLLAAGIVRWAGQPAEPLPARWGARPGDRLRQPLVGGRPPSLDAIAGPTSASLDRWTATMAAESVIEYAVATYGRERLPTLLHGLTIYESWDTLIPAVFDIPRSQFEAGWRHFLLIHHGAPRPGNSGN